MTEDGHMQEKQKQETTENAFKETISRQQSIETFLQKLPRRDTKRKKNYKKSGQRQDVSETKPKPKAKQNTHLSLRNFSVTCGKGYKQGKGRGIDTV